MDTQQVTTDEWPNATKMDAFTARKRQAFKLVSSPARFFVGKDYKSTEAHIYMSTSTPDFNIPNAEYSFTPFEE